VNEAAFHFMLLAAEQVGELSGIKPKDLSKEGIEKGKEFSVTLPLL
jgi:hypothetical protein